MEERMLNSRLEGLRDYPFQRLAALIGDQPPRTNLAPIDLSVGEPRRQPPSFAADIIEGRRDTWNRYPGINGTVESRAACARWLTRRYALSDGMIDAETMITQCAGTREGLYMAATIAVSPREDGTRPIALMPNPFYQVYVGASVLAGAEPVFLSTSKETGFLPDLDAIDEKLLARTVAFYIASPSNPQGAVADESYLARLVAMARRHGFLIFADECYCEVYLNGKPPRGMLEVSGPDFANVLVFHSLSKRSNLPGLRIGFAAGDRKFLARYIELRNIAAPQVPMPAQEVAIAAYADEKHVDKNRELYVAKFDLADQIIGNRYGYKRPAGGFFLWLDVSAQGGDEAAAKKLWREGGLRVIPGHYLARDGADGKNPGEGYIRVALVQDKEITAEALHRLVAVLG
jgi:N-succinyldiaminopimelate aminotransferase